MPRIPPRPCAGGRRSPQGSCPPPHRWATASPPPQSSMLSPLQGSAAQRRGALVCLHRSLTPIPTSDPSSRARPASCPSATVLGPSTSAVRAPANPARGASRPRSARHLDDPSLTLRGTAVFAVDRDHPGPARLSRATEGPAGSTPPTTHPHRSWRSTARSPPAPAPRPAGPYPARRRPDQTVRPGQVIALNHGVTFLPPPTRRPDITPSSHPEFRTDPSAPGVLPGNCGRPRDTR